MNILSPKAVQVILLACCLCNFFKLSISRRGGKRSGRDGGGKNLHKCNLRFDYFEEKKHIDEYPFIATASMKEANPQIEVVDEYKVRGRLTFVQQYHKGPVMIIGSIRGIPPGKKGLYILELGRYPCGNARAKGHFNPIHERHGLAKSCTRHVGDLEEIEFDYQYKWNGTQLDPRITLQGPYSIIGRTVTITLSPNDEDENSQRLACGVIGYAKSNHSFTIADFIPLTPDNDPVVKLREKCIYFIIIIGFIGYVIFVVNYCMSPAKRANWKFREQHGDLCDLMQRLQREKYGPKWMRKHYVLRVRKVIELWPAKDQDPNRPPEWRKLRTKIKSQ